MSRPTDAQRDRESSTFAGRAQAVLAAVAERMARCPYALLRHAVEATYHEGVVTLRGRVPTFFHKQVAQAQVLGLPGVDELVNRIEVT